MSQIAFHEDLAEGEYDVQVYEHTYMTPWGTLRKDICFGDFYKKGQKPKFAEYDVAVNKHIGTAHLMLKFEPK